MTTSFARFIWLCCLLLPCFVSARLKQQVSCGNGRVGTGECDDPFQCCSSDGFCAAQHCNVVSREAQVVVPATPSPTASASSRTLAPTLAKGMLGTAAPSVARGTPTMTTGAMGAPSMSPGTEAPSIATSYPTGFSTNYPTVVYNNCPNVADVMTVNFGYYQSLAAYRDPSCNRVLPGEIDVAGAGYTHIAYSFVGIDANFRLAPWNDDYATEVPMYREFNGLKAKHPNLKTIATIGGWTFNNPGTTRTYFSNITNNATLRTSFAASVVDFLEKYDFDGVDVDWEFPGRPDRGGSASDYYNLPLLIKAIRDAYTAAGKNYIVSLATPPAKGSLKQGFDMVALAQYVDFFTLLNYEIHGIWDTPPLVASATDLPFVQKAVDYILGLGISPSKLVFGLSSFGHSYNLTSASCNTAGCQFSGPGPGGCGGSPGSMPFFNIEGIIESGQYDYLRYHNASSTMEMVVNKTIYLSFDNNATWSVRSAYALEKCMRGYFWWAVDQLPGPVPLNPRAGPKPIPPTPAPTSMAPTKFPTTMPVPTQAPASSMPSSTPSTGTTAPSSSTSAPTAKSTTKTPSAAPTTHAPSSPPTTLAPSSPPTTLAPSSKPSHIPTSKPTRIPSAKPTHDPPSQLTSSPTFGIPTGPVPVQSLVASGGGSPYIGFWSFATTLALTVASSLLLI